MQVSVNLSEDTGRKLSELAAKSGKSLGEYIQLLAEQATAFSGALEDESHPESWIARWRSWAQQHSSLTTMADDSRAAIYAGRDE